MDSDFVLFYNFDPSDPPRYHHKICDAEFFDTLMSNLAGTGLTFLYRCNLAGRAYYPSRAMAPFDHECVDRRNADAQEFHRIADMLDVCDPLAEAVRAARRHGVPIWAWWNWNEFQCVRKNWVSLIDPTWYESPRHYWCSRDGSRFYHGIPAFGDEAVVQRLLALARETLEYGVDGIYLSTRSHSWYACWQTDNWAEHLEPFGFNDCVIEAYRQRHGIDIRYEQYDPDVLLKIKGEQFSTMLSRTGALIHEHDCPFVAGITPDRTNLMGAGDIPGRPHIELYKDWETWFADGSIDGLTAEQSCPHERTIPGADISPLQETLPGDAPLFMWIDTAWFVNRRPKPFCMHNWNRVTTDELLEQIEIAQRAGAAGAFLHSLYHYTSYDSDGVEMDGYGVLPRLEYFDALRELNG